MPASSLSPVQIRLTGRAPAEMLGLLFEAKAGKVRLRMTLRDLAGSTILSEAVEVRFLEAGKGGEVELVATVMAPKTQTDAERVLAREAKRHSGEREARYRPCPERDARFLEDFRAKVPIARMAHEAGITIDAVRAALRRATGGLGLREIQRQAAQDARSAPIAPLDVE